MLSSKQAPTLTCYVNDNSRQFAPGRKNPAILITPGGGYSNVCFTREGEPIAFHYLRAGFSAFVLTYSVAPEYYPQQLLEAAASMLYIRSHAEEWNIDESKIAINGYSAGGHLAASLATLYSSDKTRPDFQILFYPVISMQKGVTHGGSRKNLIGENPSQELEQKYSLERQVSPGTPQAFIMLSSDDDAVPPINGIGYFLALRDHKVPASLHAYPTGGHGWGFRDNFTYKRQWTEELEKWLREGLVFPVSEPTTKK